MVQHADAGGEAPRKPAGGHRLVPLRQVAAAWWAYRRGAIRLADLRAWLAAHETAAARGTLPAGRRPAYRLAELRRLTGLPDRRIRAALRRLDAAGLLAWDDHAPAFGDGDPALTATPEFGAFVAAIPNHRRLLPVPRRLLRWLARGARASLIAAALGHLIRGLYRRDGRLQARGRCKASWVAEAFGIGLRAVKAARAALVAVGWLKPLDDDQRARNRWGRAFVIDLAWTPPGRAGGAKSAPPPPPDRTENATPSVPQATPPGGEGHQEPAGGRPAGACAGRSGTAAPPILPPPDLREVRPADLGDVGRTDELHRQAAARGLVGPSEADRLRVLAAAEHARAVATRNPGGLFYRLVQRNWWHLLTQADEDAAARRLRASRRAEAPPPPPMPPPPARPQPPPRVAGPSADARLVAAVRRSAGRADVFLLLRRESADWTRARYDRAAAELAAPRAGGGGGATGGPTALGAALAGLGLGPAGP